MLLMNDARLPWFILVPHTEVQELYLLPAARQAELLARVNRLSAFIREELGADKLNVAAIGNVVRQLHVHVVGRRVDDHCWPGVVWGTGPGQPYTGAAVSLLGTRLRDSLGGELVLVDDRNG